MQVPNMPSMNPKDVMKAASNAMPNTSSKVHEEQLLLAKDKIRGLKHRVDEMRRIMEQYLKTIKTWQGNQSKVAVFCAESIDPTASVSKVMVEWSAGVTKLTAHVTEDLSEMFNSAVLEPIKIWLDEFKPLKGMLKDYFDARASRDHYVKKMQSLRMQMAKGKVKMDKVQRNTRKLAGAMAEYVRLEAYTLTSVTVFFKKCRNNFIQVTARHAQFQERMVKDISVHTSTYGTFAKKILSMRDPLGASPAEAAKLAAEGAKNAMANGMANVSSKIPSFGGSSGRNTSSSVGSTNSAASSDWGASERQSTSSIETSSSGGGFGGGGEEGNGANDGNDGGFGSFGNDASGGNGGEQKNGGEGNTNNGNGNNGNGGGGEDGWGDDGWGGNTTTQSMPSAPPIDDGFGGDGWGGSTSTTSASSSNNNGGAIDNGFGDWGENNDGGGGSGMSSGGGFMEQPTVPPVPPQSPISFSNPPTRAPPARPARQSLEDPFGNFDANDPVPNQNNTAAMPQQPPLQPQQQQQQPAAAAAPVQEQQDDATTGNPFLDFF
jgi:hypothetical protein